MRVEKQMTMVAMLMRPIYQLSKSRRVTKNYGDWWGCVFASLVQDDTLANHTISRYLSDRTIPEKYIQYYADWGCISPKLIEDLMGCIDTYYKDNQLLLGVYNLLINYVDNADPIDRNRLLPNTISSHPNKHEVAHLWAVLLMYAMTMDACRALFAM